MNEDIARTLNLITQGPVGNWRAWLALAGMLLMIGGMVAMMWFLSSRPTLDLTGWLCGGASVAGLALWRSMLPQALAWRERVRR